MAKKHDPDVRVSKEIHERIMSMIFPSGKGRRAFKSKNEVIEFLFQQYDNSKKPFIKYREEFENSLTKEELKVYFEGEIERINHLNNKEHLNT